MYKRQIDDSVNGNVKRITHNVGRGENLRDIAKKYGVSATDIKRLNKLRRGKVKEGDALVIEIVERKTPKASSEPLIANTITAEDTEAAEQMCIRDRDDNKFPPASEHSAFACVSVH